MNKDPLIFIEHILESIEKIDIFMKNINEEKFNSDVKLQDAVIRRIEIIGEAVKNIPDSFRKKHSKIPWIKIAGMRDKLMHHYFGVDLKTVFKVVNEDIQELKKELL